MMKAAVEESNRIWIDSGLRVLPRVLGLGDRDEGSKTYGCFDRSYWHYRLSDFPSAWFQSACHLLALAYSLEAADNPFFRNENIRRWCLAAAHFLLCRAHGDGSVDEAYPNESSYCATAFSAFHLSRTLLILKEKPDERALKMARWLMGRDNPRAANQDAAAIAALLNFSVLTGSDSFAESAREKLDGLARRQHVSGYLPEYDGYDIGYLSRTLSLLAHGVHKPDAMMERALNFLEDKIGDLGQFSIEGTSRRTQYLYPYAFVVWKHPIAGRIAEGLSRNLLIRPDWLDDRYVISLAIDYLESR